MADITKDIRSALETKLLGISGLPDVAFDNIPYSPTTGTSFIRSRFMPVNRRPAVRGLNPQQLYTGTYMVTVFSPEGEGAGAAETLATTITDTFAATSSIYYDNSTNSLLTEAEAFIVLEDGGRTLLGNVVHVSIEYSEARQGLLDTPWYSVPVVIGWYIYD